MSKKHVGIVGAILLAAVLAIGVFGTAQAQQVGPSGRGWGPGGMMGGGVGGYQGTGPGMMGGWGATTAPDGNALSLDDAKQAVENYLSQYGNSNLKVDEVMEFEDNFYAIVQEKDTGKGAMELLVNKANGAVFPEYGPNMMWNTKYGPMGGFGGGMMGGGFGGGTMGGAWGSAPQNQETVTPENAQSIAQQWLDANQAGSTTEKPDAFYGYYTVHTLRDGKVSGMLSVNAYTGQVWYHTWHGNFIGSIEAGQ